MAAKQKCYQAQFKTAAPLSTQECFLNLQQQEKFRLFHTREFIEVRGGGHLSPAAISYVLQGAFATSNRTKTTSPRERLRYKHHQNALQKYTFLAQHRFNQLPGA